MASAAPHRPQSLGLGPDQVTAAQAFPRASVGVQGPGCLDRAAPLNWSGQAPLLCGGGLQAWPRPPLPSNGVGDDDGSSQHSPRVLRAKSYVFTSKNSKQLQHVATLTIPIL